MFFTPLEAAVNKITTVPAPIGGLNARDSLAAMAETDAVILKNFWPQPYGVAVRKGYQQWATELGGEVLTLGVWSGVSGAQYLFGWANKGMFNCTTRGPVGAPLLTGLSNDTWQLAGFTNAAGGHLLAVNGEDDGICYDETGVHRLIVGDGVVAYTWKGLDPKDAIQLTVHQHRVWAVELDSAVGWYLPPDAIYGELQPFDFGPLFWRGGYLSFLATWTMDDGNGAEDHLVAVSSTGLAVVYAGIDPAAAETWKLVGVYNVGAPVKGRRGYTKVAGDLYLLTQQGVVSMASLLVSTKVNQQVSAFKSDKIQFLISDLIGQYVDLAGWVLMYAPKINMLLCNVPTGIYAANFQLASNQLIDAWTQFGGMDAACWNTFGDHPFFGDYNGTVYIAWEGSTDGVLLDGTGGDSITAEAQQAFSYLGALGQQKQVGMYRPNFIVSTPVSYNSNIIYDFSLYEELAPDGMPVPEGASVWGTALWGIATWYGGASPQRSWRIAQGVGVAASTVIGLRANSDALWVSTDFSYTIGGIL
jgi:hypothetical protein